MKATRRRARRPDPLASADGVGRVFEHLRAALPEIIPRSQKNIEALLNSVRGLYARPGAGSKRGRPGRFAREDLLRVDSQLRSILARETSVSVRSFVGQYLPVLKFPRDVLEALERGDVNLFEAHQLARLRPARLGLGEAGARSLRERLLSSHLASRGSGAALRGRVREALGEVTAAADSALSEAAAVAKADELLESDPLDSSHLFFEELRMILRALRDVSPRDVTEEELSEIMPAVDQIALTLRRIERRKDRGGAGGFAI
jgi:hypothetical protein